MKRHRLRWSIAWIPAWVAASCAGLLGTTGCGGGGGAGAAVPVAGDGDVAPVPPVAPSVTGVVQADRDGLAPLVLVGEGFVAPCQVEVEAEAGQPSRVVPARATDGGRRVEADDVRVPGAGARTVRRVRVRNGDGRASDPVDVPFERRYPSIDGTRPDLPDPAIATAGRPFLRLAAPDYDDGSAAPSGARRPSARVVSNAVAAEDRDRPARNGATDLLWQWGQFVDHDLDLTLQATPEEPLPIPVPRGDPFFDPFATGTQSIPLRRSAYVADAAPRAQTNAITAWMDGSQVYGSDDATARSLRALDGSGRLRAGDGDLLPRDAAGAFLAGDVRANEQVGLLAMHTLFLREHNRTADALRGRRPDLDDEQLYQEARRRTVALLQAVTVREFLPILLGPDALPPYAGFSPTVDPRVANEFATAAFRLGHSLLNPRLARRGPDGETIPEGDLALRDAFFAPHRLTEGGGIEPLLRGLCLQRAQALDGRLVDDVRNFLFGPPGAGGLDLAALNVQRGRDHGLPSYAAMRRALGLPSPASFAAVSSDPETRARLEAVYDTVEDVDLWVGLLAEDARPGAMVGPTLHRIVADQFRRTRDGDPCWYERVLAREEREEVERSRLIDVIRRNTAIRDEVPDDPWRVRGAEAPPPPRTLAAAE